VVGKMLADEVSGAEHAAVPPPPEPLQVHVHGPLPLTAEAVPLVQRVDVGTPLTATRLALPQAPFTGEAAREADHSAVDKPILIRIQRC
jgi:hypothetical protein